MKNIYFVRKYIFSESVIFQVAINAALGFDTYLVMRHGAGPSVHGLSSANKDQPAKSASRGLEEPRLGCYFCNDVVAPEDVSHL